jgi:uncharacterized protein YciI
MIREVNYLYKIQPIRIEMLNEGTTASEEQTISDHFEYLQKLINEGIVFLAGRTLNTDLSTFGIVLLSAGSENEARRIMENDPAVMHRVMYAELFPYRIALLAKDH